jgi:polygalacturonase
VWGVDGLEVRHVDISARRTNVSSHDPVDMTAFNTDGFDVTGNNVWIHDCSVWNQDDCIAVKDGSSNMLFERITASGVGLTIGSIGGSTVRNITFRDCVMPNSFKGLYLKFRDSGGLIADVLYENIVIESPNQWPIWLGPAQQSDSAELCAAHPCSICWPQDPKAKCNAPAAGSYANITFRNITINNAKLSPGVLLGNATNPMVRH